MAFIVVRLHLSVLCRVKATNFPESRQKNGSFQSVISRCARWLLHFFIESAVLPKLSFLRALLMTVHSRLNSNICSVFDIAYARKSQPAINVLMYFRAAVKCKMSLVILDLTTDKLPLVQTNWAVRPNCRLILQ